MLKITTFKGRDISSLKIYLDDAGNFRHRFYCAKCNSPMVCMCYKTLEAAVNELDHVINHILCNRHYLLHQISFMEAYEDYAYKFQDMLPAMSLILDKVNTLIIKIKSSEGYTEALREELTQMIEEVALHHLTDQQILELNSELDEDYDYSPVGDYCKT